MSGLLVADLDPIERLYARATHDLECSDEPAGHELEEHEPWSEADLEGVIPWPDIVEALRRRGLALVAIEAPADPARAFVRWFLSKPVALRDAWARENGYVRAAAAVPPNREALSDRLGHALDAWLAPGSVDPSGHNAQANGEPHGDCYKCRRVRDFLRAVLLGDDAPDAEVAARAVDYLADARYRSADGQPDVY